MVESVRRLVAFALAAALCACAPAAQAPRAAADPEPIASFSIPDEDLGRDPRAVSGEEAARDLDFAARAFAEAYAGVDGAPPVPSPAQLAEARVELLGRARWTPADLGVLFANVFRRPDGHLAFGWDGRSPAHIPAWPRTERAPRREEGRRFALALLSGDGSGESLASGVFFRRAAREHAEPVQVSSVEHPRERGSAVEIVFGAVPRLVVRTFDAAAAVELERLPAIAAWLRDLPAFVIDVRGNGGGNYRYAERFVLALTDAPLRRLDEREVVSAAAAEGRANSARRRLALGEVPDAAVPVFRAHADALAAKAASLRASGAPRTELVSQGAFVRGDAPGPLRARVVLLVDGGCASACEMMVSLARQIPGVTIAGEPTRGSMAAGEIALFRLPRSGLTLSLGTRAFRDPRGGFAEIRGYLPDVVLPREDMVAAAEEIVSPRSERARSRLVGAR
jgi:hypothetical protein